MSATARRQGSAGYLFFAVTSIFLCLSLALPGLLPGQPINEGFDSFVAPDWDVPAGWTFFGIEDGDIYDTVNNYGLAPPSIKLDDTGNFLEHTSLHRPEELSFWVKGQGTGLSSFLLVEEYYGGWNQVTQISPLPTVGTVLGPFSLQFLTTGVKFTYDQAPGEGDLAFDDVIITEADPTPSVTPTPPPTATPTPSIPPTATPIPSPTGTPLPNFFNNSFERGDRSGWYVPDSATESRINVTDDFAFPGDGGIYSLVFEDPTQSGSGRAIETSMFSRVPVVAGLEYIIYGYFFLKDDGYPNPNDTMYRFNVRWFDEEGEQIREDQSGVQRFTDFQVWTRYEHNLIAPDGAVSVGIYINCNTTGSNNNDVRIDNFNLTRPPDIEVTSPERAAAWFVGQNRTIRWNSIGEVGRVDIHYSIDNGNTWIELASDIPNVDFWPWTVLPPPTFDGRIRIRETARPHIYGISERFTIAAGDSINVVAPGGGEEWFRGVTYDITFSSGPDISRAHPVDIYYSTDDGVSWTEITSGVTLLPQATMSVPWTIPNEDSPNSRVRVRQPATGKEGVSPGVFTLSSPRITLTSPRGGEIWYWGENRTVTWTSTRGVGNVVSIDYSPTGPDGPWIQIAAYADNTGSFSFWNIPDINTENARVRISDAVGIGLPGISGDFTIVGTRPPQPPTKREWERWMQVEIPDGCNILTIEAYDENNIWLGLTCGLIYYWNGTSWRLQGWVSSNIRDFVAFRPDLVYGAGEVGKVYRYNGVYWDEVPAAEGTRRINSLDGPDPAHLMGSSSLGTLKSFFRNRWIDTWVGESGTLRSVVYLRPDRAYTARSSTDTMTAKVFFSEDQGQTWATVADFSAWDMGFNDPMTGCIDGLGRSRLWIVGSCGEIQHYNGTSWGLQTRIEFLGGRTVEALDENNVWASIGGDIYAFNGTEWFLEESTLPTIYEFSAVSNRLVYAIGSTASRWIFRAIGDATPTPYQPTPVGFKTPSPTPAPVSGPIRGRVYDRVTGQGVKNVYVRALPDEPGLRPAGGYTDSSGNYVISNLLDGSLEAGVYKVGTDGGQGSGIRVYREQWYNQKNTQRVGDRVASNSSGIDFPLYRIGVFPTPPPSPTPAFSAIRVAGGDYSGDGIDDIAIFRPASGLWAVRGFTRTYFGGAGDIPVSGDYSGDGWADIALFRPAAGLWAVKDLTRVYYGGAGDIPVPGDYDGDGAVNIAVFRPDSGLWAVHGLGRTYFGGLGDVPVSGDYTGDGFADLAVFRPGSGLWAVKDVTRLYFGGSADLPVPGDYAGIGFAEPAIFRPSSGLWAVRGVTRFYFGNAAYQAVPAGYSGSWQDQGGVFRPETGLWAIRGLTRVYYGGAQDLPVTR